MAGNIFHIIFTIGALAYLVMLGVSRSRSRQNVITDRRESVMHSLLSILSFLGTHVIPFVYIFASWLSFADYRLPALCSWIGAVIFAASLGVIGKAHIDLDCNWSMRMEIAKGQAVVTRGIYCRVRHPIYAAMWLWGIGQTLLLHNRIAGPAALLLFVPIYFYRVPREEQMMREHFGEEYQAYIKRTGRLLPKIG
ncbi:MAG: isoprenylcysteine carboxylmethyltransferase family protein [Anaerolineae bacterium]|nr:isoprenylcysteine carboxylmethyltransferase family protein [Anaerolineae bacterium]